MIPYTLLLAVPSADATKATHAANGAGTPGTSASELDAALAGLCTTTGELCVTLGEMCAGVELAGAAGGLWPAGDA